MAVYLATKTIEAIKKSIEIDQGASFRKWQKIVLPHIADAYRGTDEGVRQHLGASLLGRECPRELWYSFRWFQIPKFDDRMIRLFNRGHLEEGRFIAMLLCAGMGVFQQDANGKQFRISDAGGHLGGSGDGIITNCPDLNPNEKALCEFKTHGDKSFTSLKKEGVRISKPEHYVQMQTYMHKMNFQYALYLAVNKNTDELYGEIILLDSVTGPEFIERGTNIIFMKTAPTKIANSEAFFKCRFCNFNKICHRDNKAIAKNCRTCKYSEALPDGSWVCNHSELTHGSNPLNLSFEVQIKGCEQYEVIEA